MKRKLWQTFDWSLFIVPLILVSAGIAVLFSLSFQDTANFAIHQIIFAILGLGLCIVFTFLNYQSLKPVAYILYFVGLVLLVAVLFLGKTKFGATRWISLGFFQLQPSEVFKLILVIVLAKFFSSVEHFHWKYFILIIALAFAPVFLVIKQPDVGTSLVLVIIFFSIIFTASISKIYWWVMGTGIVVFLPVIWFFLRDYQKARIYTFLNPMADPLNRGYHVLQSTITVGSGGLLGRGLGQGSQSVLQFLPEAHTDFIFAGWAEATGFVGSLILILLLVFLIWRIISIAMISRDNFGTFLAIGFASMFLFQLLVNVGMNLGIMPVTGIPLPLVSYGGSSLLVNFIALGILQSIYIRHKKLRF